MGRRSINTTKSGKYMNPTDQARKEARKKELKKNKRQRQMVRAAVLKGKDPYQIISEMERIDQMEYNVLQPSPLNEKVLKDKRKKLKDTLERVLKMYDKDDPERWAELKLQEADYEKRRSALLSYYESVRHAQQVQIEEIPLPIAAVQGGMLPGDLSSGIPAQIPLPTDIPQLQLPPPPGILRKRSAYSPPPKPKKPPGVPPGPPPELSDDEDDVLMKEAESADSLRQNASAPSGRRIRFEDDYGDHPGEGKDQQGAPVYSEDNQAEQDRNKINVVPSAKPQPTALQQKMLAMAGQDIDQFMREMEEVHRKKEADRQADLQARLAAISETGDETGKDRKGVDNRSRDFRDRDREREFRDRDFRDRDRERDKDRDRDFRDRDERQDGEDESEVSGMLGQPNKTNPNSAPPMGGIVAGQQPTMPPGPPPLMSLPHMMFRPPPPRLGAPPMQGVRLPPGPPPGRPPSLPPGPPPGLPPRLNLRLPPGPPPGMPPRLMRLPTGVPMPNMPPPMLPLGAVPVPGSASATPNVLTAAPQLINRGEGGEGKGGATIEAKPQIRNLSADVTRFLPTALRVKRDEKTKPDRKAASDMRAESIAKHMSVGPPPPGVTKDDAYQQFMREMEGLL